MFLYIPILLSSAHLIVLTKVKIDLKHFVGSYCNKNINQLVWVMLKVIEVWEVIRYRRVG